MTTRERLFLTSFEKFVKYGIVPWKMLLHVALVAIVTGQVRHCFTFGTESLLAKAPLRRGGGGWPDPQCRRMSHARTRLQIVFNNGQEINYLQAASRNWYYYLYPDDYDFSE